jgi:gluconokinase
MEARSDHFFDAELLDSQFEALEPPGAEEAYVVDVDARPAAIVDTICDRVPGLPDPG